MAIAPILKIYSPQGEYVASCKYREDAAVLAGWYGAGAKVKKGHSGKILWHEGHEHIPANESADGAAQIMGARW